MFPPDDTCLMTRAVSGCYAGGMAFSRLRIPDTRARLPFIDAWDPALTLGEAYRALTAVTLSNPASGRRGS